MISLSHSLIIDRTKTQHENLKGYSLIVWNLYIYPVYELQICIIHAWLLSLDESWLYKSTTAFWGLSITKAEFPWKNWWFIGHFSSSSKPWNCLLPSNPVYNVDVLHFFSHSSAINDYLHKKTTRVTNIPVKHCDLFPFSSRTQGLRSVTAGSVPRMSRKLFGLEVQFLKPRYYKKNICTYFRENGPAVQKSLQKRIFLDVLKLRDGRADLTVTDPDLDHPNRRT